MVDRNIDTPLSLTQGLGRFVAAPGFSEVPVDLAPLIRNGIIDTLACLLAGRNEAVTQMALQVATARSIGAAWATAPMRAGRGVRQCGGGARA